MNENTTHDQAAIGGDVSDLHLYAKAYTGKLVRVTAILPAPGDDPDPNPANGWMREHDGEGLLALRAGLAFIARNEDEGVAPDKVPTPEAPRETDQAPSVTVALPVTPALVDTILCGVIESGLDSWFQWSGVVHRPDPEMPNVPQYVSAMCAEWDEVEGEVIAEPVLVDAACIAEGIRKILSGEVGINKTLTRQISDGLRTNHDADIDAEAADCIIQAAVFGELRYG